MNWNFLKTEIEPGDFLIDCRSQSAYEEETLEGAYYYPFIKKAFGSDPESQKKLYGPMAAVIQEFQKSKKHESSFLMKGWGCFPRGWSIYSVEWGSKMLMFLVRNGQ